MLKNKKNQKEDIYLITGGLGFVGKNLVKFLIKNKKKPYVVDIFEDSIFKDKNKIPFRMNQIFYEKVNLLDKKQVFSIIKRIKPSIIIHLASITDLSRDFVTAHKCIDIIIKGSLILLEACKNISNFKRFIYISSSDIYGNSTPPFNELMLPNPSSPYSVTKLCVENFLILFYQSYKIPFTILRSFNLFGEYQNMNRLIGQLMVQSSFHKDINLTSGEQKREFNYVGNLIDAIISCIATKKTIGEIYNVGCGKSYKIKDIALLVAKFFNNEKNLHFGAIPYRTGEIWDMVCDNSKLMSDTSWIPNIDLLNGLKKTYIWYSKHYR